MPYKHLSDASLSIARGHVSLLLGYADDALQTSRQLGNAALISDCEQLVNTAKCDLDSIASEQRRRGETPPLN